MQLSRIQGDTLVEVESWFKYDSRSQQVFRLFGYAGTGKTTLAKHLAGTVKGLVLYAAYTGKAALVMRKNGCHGAQTIHSLIYRPKAKKDGTVEFVLNSESPLVDAALLIVDECSMVDENLAKDLLSFKVPILVLGDPAQLPPVKGSGYFTEARPNVMLTEIHRQASDNPIIRLATMVREGKKPTIGDYGDSRIISAKNFVKEDALKADQILVGRNMTRGNMNKRMRKFLGRDDSLFPLKGDKLICLRNDSTLGIFNGGLFTAERTVTGLNKEPDFLYVTMTDEDDDNSRSITAKIHKSLFDPEVNELSEKQKRGSSEFDFGYAITCHKSQGSQWDNVLIYDESYCFNREEGGASRWLYTAITRASQSVTLVYT